MARASAPYERAREGIDEAPDRSARYRRLCTPAPTLETEVHLPPITSVLQAHGVQDRRWFRHATVERTGAPAVSSGRGREREPRSMAFGHNHNCLGMRKTLHHRCRKDFKIIDQNGCGRPGYYRGELCPASKTPIEQSNMKLSDEPSWNPSDSAIQ